MKTKFIQRKQKYAENLISENKIKRQLFNVKESEAQIMMNCTM
jgi:hypothetical protein